jgi:hypothetical protein
MISMIIMKIVDGENPNAAKHELENSFRNYFSGIGRGPQTQPTTKIHAIKRDGNAMGIEV